LAAATVVPDHGTNHCKAQQVLVVQAAVLRVIARALAEEMAQEPQARAMPAPPVTVLTFLVVVVARVVQAQPANLMDRQPAGPVCKIAF
tara:strand:- start:269 stop:535 length:267 start_codon:yes stop_codon:yes gene_type:complete